MSDATRPRRRGAALLACLLPALIAGCLPASAEPLRAVLELYTSQGCAVCPPADHLLGDLARRPGILALTFPVTYWDYLGWKDTFGHSLFTERQRAYATAHGEVRIYTPELVINGGAALAGGNRSGIEKIVQDTRAGSALRVPVRAEEQGGRIVVEIGADPEPPGRADVWLVPLLRSRAVTVDRGENKGRVVAYVNVVRGLYRLGAWSGQAVRFEAPRSAVEVGEADSYAVLVQGALGGRPGRIWGAAKGPGL
ncbi:DUF1223 domain-containing protein [Methylobacterium durans]|uniref:DUF1223 domain-containing protein n=1 Tax=Methylobacterium durans TaxID=2202825 RepID=A0A2U8WEU3_9HYPH|nr:DUF1223 domain-containing protein [Methylobacterium durans]AWN44068.1 DUF1223 domain-containing protein [Methylobacterium durans]MEA1832884.1 DUF1223 domain-containing protein [Methylobacterium durans]